jgi:catechol 2,3-dioxygenase-like lactoylglutathione lyase family enzyme
MSLEVLVVPVTDVDRAKRFYLNLGFRVDVDYTASEDYRIIQLTPPGSATSIIIGKGITARRAPIDRLVLAVYDIEAARRELLSHGVQIGEVFHDAAGGLGAGFYSAGDARAPGADPRRRSYASYASFNDPDGNVWLLQEIKERLPGRGVMTNVAALAQLLHETSEHHGPFEAAAPPHDWWHWYASYIDARERGSTPEEASAAAARYMAEVQHVALSPA